ncbi:MAG: Mur ligase family protein [Pirellulaceae bacterium]
MPYTLDRAGSISLRQIFPDGHILGGSDVQVTSCSGEARACRPGDLFVALVGVDDDGHDQVRMACRRGATAILAERPLPVDVPVCVVPDTRIAYGRLCQRLAGDPGESLRVVGVTGTNGKTTTTMLITAVLDAAEQVVGVTSTLGHSDCLKVTPAARTTPNPPELADLLRRMSANGGSHAVVEVSSSGLAQHRLAGLPLDAAVLTNLRRDHLDLHGTVLNYRRAKCRLFSYLKPNGFAVINADDPGSRFALSQLQCPVVTVGMREQAEIMATVVERHSSEQTFLLIAGNETVPVRTRMVGDQHVSNCLAAAAVGLVMGIDLTTVARGLEVVERIPGRMDRIECGQTFGVYADCADTPDRLAVGLKTLRRTTQGRVMCVFSADDEQHKEERPLMGRLAEKAADLGVITSSWEGSADSAEAIHDVLDGYDRPARAHVIPDRAQAIAWVLSQAREGDSVLIAGGDRTEGMVDNGYGLSCRDAEIARNWLYESSRDTIEFSGIAMG